MPAAVVIGAQWGDEGKGKAVDVFSSRADYVIRYQGGANAGHTLKVEGREMVLHLIPSGILHSGVICVISSGVAVDISTLCQEIQALTKAGFLRQARQLLISDSATLLLDFHKKLDQAREAGAGHEKIGTTGKGIGPAYESRAERTALIFADLFEDDNSLLGKLKKSAREKNFLLENFYKQPPASIDDIFEELLKAREILQPHRSRDTSLVIDQALKKGKKVLFEGAQGSLLDLFHGTYPYVTSSSTLAGGALTGGGLGPCDLNRVLAVFKAYTTRVGFGPFPTECSETPEGRHLQKQGREFGATTGRMRRCGWLDLPALRYAVRLNGITGLALMKLDVLSGLKEIKVCVSYNTEGESVREFSGLYPDFARARPEYKTFKGWTENLSGLTKKEDLPPRAAEYVNFIQQELNIPVDMISVGPSRKETLWINPLFPADPGLRA